MDFNLNSIVIHSHTNLEILPLISLYVCSYLIREYWVPLLDLAFFLLEGLSELIIGLELQHLGKSLAGEAKLPEEWSYP